jgi:transcriptional regulator with XRE-family HTH domain
MSQLMAALAQRDAVIDDLRIARLRQRIPQRVVAEAMGVSQAALSHWENGQRDPNLSIVIKWARALGYTIELLDPTNEGDPNV